MSIVLACTICGKKFKSPPSHEFSRRTCGARLCMKAYRTETAGNNFAVKTREEYNPLDPQQGYTWDSVSVIL